MVTLRGEPEARLRPWRSWPSAAVADREDGGDHRGPVETRFRKKQEMAP
jgi:hypothetical protein